MRGSAIERGPSMERTFAAYSRAGWPLSPHGALESPALSFDLRASGLWANASLCGRPTCLCWPCVTGSPVGTLMASKSKQKLLSFQLVRLVWVRVWLLEGHTDWVLALTVLPDVRLASSSPQLRSRDRTIRVW
jgi:hypothetical protein